MSVGYVVWHSGAMYAGKVHDNEQQYYGNRLSLVQLALVAFSSLLYLPLKSNENFIDPLLLLFCSQWNSKAKEVLFSLLNFAFNHEEGGFVLQRKQLEPAAAERTQRALH